MSSTNNASPRDAGPREALVDAAIAGSAASLVALAFFWSYAQAMGEPWALGGDNQLIQFPIAFEAYRGWSESRIPEWSTRLWSGYPLLADPIGGPLYVPHMLAFALTAAPHLFAFDVSTGLHCGLFVAGTVFLLRLLQVSRVAAAFGGALLLLAPFSHQWATHLIPQYSALAYWPWLFAAAEMLRRPETSPVGGFAWLGWLAMAGQVMAGYPEFALYSGIVAGLWILVLGDERTLGSRLGRAISLGFGGLALAAPQLLTTAAVLSQSMRGEGPNPWLSHALSLPWTAPLHPPAGTSVTAQFATFLGYASLLLSLVAVARRGRLAWFIASVAAIGYVLSLGPGTPLYPALHALPPFAIFRGPLKFWQLTEVSVALLAALGADVLLRPVLATRRRDLVAAAALVLIAGALVERGAYTAQRLRHYARFRADLLPRQGEMLRSIEDSGLVERASSERFSRTLFAAHPELIFGNMNVVFGVDSLRGGPAQLLGRTHGPALRNAGRPGLLDRAGARFVLASTNTCDHFAAAPDWQIVETRPTLCLLERTPPPLRYEVLAEAAPLGSVGEMVERMRADATLPVGVVLDAGPSAGPPGAAGEARILEESPGRARLRVSTDHEALLLVRESWTPGWSAAVDDVAAQIHRAGGPFFAVAVPAGEHLVEIEYRARGLREGTALALMWAVIALLLAMRRARAGVH